MARKKNHSSVCDDCKRGTPDVREYHDSINRVMSGLDERSRRLFAGLLARQLGRGGRVLFHKITGLSRVTIRRGIKECESGQDLDAGRIRQSGGGRLPVEKMAIESFIDSMNF